MGRTELATSALTSTNTHLIEKELKSVKWNKQNEFPIDLQSIIAAYARGRTLVRYMSHLLSILF
jgi:hypothetical protein